MWIYGEITFSSTATFRMFHKNSNKQNINPNRHPKIRMTNIPPTSLTSNSAESSFGACKIYYAYFVYVFKSVFFTTSMCIRYITGHFWSSGTDHHLSFSSISCPDSESLNNAILTAVLWGASENARISILIIIYCCSRGSLSVFM